MEAYLENEYGDKIVSVTSLKPSIVDHDIITEGQRVLALEAQALSLVASSLNATFTECIDLILSTKGRVIVTGMGKSGHVARKIAATLASTGTPAFFIHPAEASHGDLGMVYQEDCVLALSNSGETRELSDLIHYTNRFHVPLIAMTSKAESTLARNARAALILPTIEEACSLNLVPTTSTTMMMALGDALAVALLKKQGFTSSDFGNFHPGGKLGQRVMFVKKFMHDLEQTPLVSQGSTMKEAIQVMTNQKFGCVGVVDQNGLLTGIITDGDLRRHLSPTLINQIVDNIMTKSPRITHPNALAVEALALMNQKRITNLFVVESPENMKPVGIIHVHDCLEVGMA